MTNIIERINLATGQDFTRLGTTDKAKVGRCPMCGARVLTGLDSDPAGIPVRADITPLRDGHEELAALLAGRATFDLRKIGRLPRLRFRDQYQVADKPPDTTTVLAEHKCNGQENGSNE